MRLDIVEEMQPYFPAYMPEITPPCFTLRSRRETQTTDTNNSRFVEHWQTDSPSLINAPRDVRGVDRYQDMNPTPSRLYREDMRQSQPFVIPLQNMLGIEEGMNLDKMIQKTLKEIERLTAAKDTGDDLKNQQELYRLLLQRRRQATVDSLTKNPYFDKYDVDGDTRNIIRELRSVVYEDVVDRGMAESQKLIRRGMENRWMPAHFAESEKLDSLNAYDLMRPKFNKQEKIYF